MRISDWSSDVCPSDLGTPVFPPPQELPLLREGCTPDRLQGRPPASGLRLRARQDRSLAHHLGEREETARTRPGDQARPSSGPAALSREVRRRSEERRVGKEWVSTWRTRW